MPEAPTPTYREQTRGEQTLYECLIPDAGKPEQICGHLTLNKDNMATHMAQRHAGTMIEEKQSEKKQPEKKQSEDQPEAPAQGASPAVTAQEPSHAEASPLPVEENPEQHNITQPSASEPR